MTPFDRAFAFTVGEEAGFTADPRDKGNWTGGQCGVGECRGTKFGISAASYPTVDIANLTLETARAIYLRDYWTRIAGDSLPPGLGMLAFDAAVNNGVGQAVRWMQSAAGVDADGILGPRSLLAIRNADPQALMAEFQAQRMAAMAALPTWSIYGRGWARRLCRVMLEAAQAAA